MEPEVVRAQRVPEGGVAEVVGPELVRFREGALLTLHCGDGREELLSQQVIH